jgi:uncharacterized protein YcfJ
MFQKSVIAAASTVLTTAAFATQPAYPAHPHGAQPGFEWARVVTTVPVVQQVSVPRQVCTLVPVVSQYNDRPQRAGYSRNAPDSGATTSSSDGGSVAGMVIGGLVGGALGNNVGKGSGRAVATAAGIIGGAALGYHAGARTKNDRTTTSSSGQTFDGNVVTGPVTTVIGPHGDVVAVAPALPSEYVRHEQRCNTQSMLESKTVGYNVTYEYAGKQYTTQFANDPGQWVQIQVAPVGSTSSHSSGRTQIIHRTEYVPYVQPVHVNPVHVQPIYVHPVRPVHVHPVHVPPKPRYRHHGWY